MSSKTEDFRVLRLTDQDTLVVICPKHLLREQRRRIEQAMEQHRQANGWKNKVLVLPEGLRLEVISQEDLTEKAESP